MTLPPHRRGESPMGPAGHRARYAVTILAPCLLGAAMMLYRGVPACPVRATPAPMQAHHDAA